MLSQASRRLIGIVRGDGAWAATLRSGEIALDGPTAALAVALTAAYGLGMGIFGVVHGDGAWQAQLLANIVKVPALALISFALTSPAFFAANALGGLRLSAGSTLRLCAATFAVFAAVLGVLAPAAGLVSAFCNYSFATLINLAFFAAAGGMAVLFVLRTVDDLARAGVSSGGGPGEGRARSVRPLIAFAVWAVLFGLVGTQIGWKMRPLIGWRDAPFRWYRADGMTLWDGVVSEICNIITVGGV